jgi:hypothetical protein
MTGEPGEILQDRRGFEGARAVPASIHARAGGGLSRCATGRERRSAGDEESATERERPWPHGTDERRGETGG